MKNTEKQGKVRAKKNLEGFKIKKAFSEGKSVRSGTECKLTRKSGSKDTNGEKQTQQGDDKKQIRKELEWKMKGLLTNIKTKLESQDRRIKFRKGVCSAGKSTKSGFWPNKLSVNSIMSQQPTDQDCPTSQFQFPNSQSENPQQKGPSQIENIKERLIAVDLPEKMESQDVSKPEQDLPKEETHEDQPLGRTIVDLEKEPPLAPIPLDFKNPNSQILELADCNKEKSVHEKMEQGPTQRQDNMHDVTKDERAGHPEPFETNPQDHIIQKPASNLNPGGYQEEVYAGPPTGMASQPQTVIAQQNTQPRQQMPELTSEAEQKLLYLKDYYQQALQQNVNFLVHNNEWKVEYQGGLHSINEMSQYVNHLLQQQRESQTAQAPTGYYHPGSTHQMNQDQMSSHQMNQEQMNQQQINQQQMSQHQINQHQMNQQLINQQLMNQQMMNQQQISEQQINQLQMNQQQVNQLQMNQQQVNQQQMRHSEETGNPQMNGYGSTSGNNMNRYNYGSSQYSNADPRAYRQGNSYTSSFQIPYLTTL